jgi:pantoate--beta-alanine ligase
MQDAALALRAAGRRIGVVPTMGYLHDGHASLIRLARTRADVVIVTLFVNPTQFGPNEDLSRYPRDFERDRALCEAEGADILFAPEPGTVYATDHSVWIDEDRLSRGLCGASRPGHFRGVCTVVAKLFNLTQPHVAVFGEKDAQQLRVIRRMVRDLDIPVEIIAGPTAREPDGLAMSSRNACLSPEERAQAVCLRRALDEATGRLAAGERDAARLRAAMAEVVAGAPLAHADYVEIVDDETLEPVTTIDRPALAALAVFVGRTRLIDNTVLRP